MMKNKFNVGFWENVAHLVLRNRIIILISIGVLTFFLGLQWKNVGMTYNEANLLPKNHVVNQQYTRFLNIFGEEGNLVVIGVKNNTFFTPKAYQAWTVLMRTLQSQKEIELVVSLNDLKKLQKNEVKQTFEMINLIDQRKTQNAAYLQEIKIKLFNELPFYEGLLFNKKSGSIRSVVYINKQIVNSPVRKKFIINVLVPAVQKFENEIFNCQTLCGTL